MLFDTVTNLKPKAGGKFFDPDGSSLQMVTQQFDRNLTA